MKKLFTVLVAGVFLAFFMIGALADKNAYVNVDDGVCSFEAQEQVLLKAMKKNPELLMVGPIQEKELKWFFDRVKSVQMMMGNLDVDKVYVFLSEHHSHWVYVFYLNKNCIVDVNFTYKNLVEFFITGDRSLITPKGS